MSGKRGFIVRVHGSMTEEVRSRMTGGAPGGVLGEHGGAWESVDTEGKPYFRVVVVAETAEAARATVQDWLAGLDLEIGAADRHATLHLAGRYEEVVRGAIEHFVLEVLRAQAAEGERLERIADGHEPPKVIASIRLRGSHPETVLEIGQYDRARDEWRTSSISVWKDDRFTAAAATVDALTEWVSDLLMRLRGG